MIPEKRRSCLIRFSFRILLAAALLLASSELPGEEIAAVPPVRSIAAEAATTNHRREIQFWGDVSFDTTSMGGLTASDVRGRKLVLAGFRYGRVLVRSSHLALFYTLDLIPFAAALSSEVEKAPTSNSVRRNVYGWGASPIGVCLHVRRKSNVQPFLAASGGFLHFQEPVPAPEGTRWNLAATGGGGIRFLISTRRALDAGYMFHHLSNGRERTRNPSLNTQVVYAGVSFLTN